MRVLTSATSTELAAGSVRPALFVELDFASGFVRMWTGIGPVTVFGNVYTGAGMLGSISAIKESLGFQANGISVGLSGIPSSMLAIALAESYQGRSATVYLGFFNSANALIPDPFIPFKGRMDTMQIRESGDTSSITLTAESRAIALKKANGRRYTHEDQQELSPGDMFLNFINSLQDAEIVWKPI